MFIMVFMVSLVSVGFAEQETVSDANEVLSFPYVAQITGDDVYIRSGPGTQYYRCGKLNKTDRVKVVGSQFSWSRIVPPKGSFSWIFKEYVKVDAENPTIGIVTGDRVRIYAGSPYLEPIHSKTLQLQFDKGDKVRLLDEEKGDYYKITPPKSAYLWVSTRYIMPIGKAGHIDVEAEQYQIPDIEEIVVTPAPIVGDSQFLKEYYRIEKQIKKERKKAFNKQNYEAMKKALFVVANSKDAGKADRYAKFALKQVKSFEMALTVTKDLELQDQKLRKVNEGIEKARKVQIAGIPDLGKFAVIGNFETSILYSPDSEQPHFRIINDSGKTLCYVTAAGNAVKLDLSKFAGRKVGLIGKIKPHIQTRSALVEFSEITKLP